MNENEIHKIVNETKENWNTYQARTTKTREHLAA
jgi:hypothetical protein